MSKLVANKQKYSVKVRCAKESHITDTVLGGGGRLSFKCEACGDSLFVDTVHLELSGHGKTVKTLGHTLLALKELGKAE